MYGTIVRSLILVCIGFIPGLAEAQGLTGNWEGTATQYGPGTYVGNYETKMILNGKTGTIDYPSLGCGGQLTFIEQRGSAYAYRERLTYGRDRCTSGGLVTVIPTEGGVQWEWTLDSVVKATLKSVR